MAETQYALISRWRLLSAVCLAVLLSGATPAFAEERSAVEGIVVDSQERPVSGAEVALEFPDGTAGIRHTGPEGRFRFEDVKSGPATLRVTAKGFEVLRQAMAGEDAGASLRLHLRIAPLRTGVTVTGSHPASLRTQVDEIYNRNKSISTLNGLDVANFNPVANYSALRLLPGVMTAAYGGRDRFSLPTHIRGGHAWGIVETIDDYPAINITPVNAEDGGYTAGFSSVIPSIAVESLSVATGGLGVSYGQASGGVVRNQIRRGSAGNITSSVRLEMLSLGEGIAMADTGGGFGRVDYYVAGQSSLADYGTAYDTFPRPIEGLRLGSGVAKVGVRVTQSSRWETMYAGGGERHDYFQNASIAGQPARREFHTDKSNHFLATRYNWRRSEDLDFGLGVTQNWFHENRIEDFAAGIPVGLSRRNRPQRATRAFSTFNWRTPITDSVSYTASGGGDFTWDRFRDTTASPISFSFREQAGYWRNSLAISRAVTLNGGVRVANIGNGFRNDARVLYDVGAAWIVPATQTRLFGSWSTGYKLNKAFYLWWGGGQFIRRHPAAGLDPSTTETTEVGLEQPISFGGKRTGRVRVSVFSARESDLFNFGDSHSGLPYYDDARTRGAELWTEWRIWRLRPFASFTWLRSYRDASTNPEAADVDLRFAPLPNYSAGFGSHVDLHPRLILSIYGYYDDGGVSQEMLNDEVMVTRYGSFSKINASLAWVASSRWSLFSRIENLFHRRDLGFDRTTIGPDGSARRTAGTQRDPGLVASGGVELRF